MNNEKAFFKKTLDTKRETTVNLKKDVPVHLVYRTAWSPIKGRMQYRRDVYGRDAKIFNALAKSGVTLRALSR